VPAPEAHERVHAHAQEALGPVGHRRRRDAQHVLGQRGRQLPGALEGGAELAEEHRRVDLEVDVVAAVERVEASLAGRGEVPVVGLDRSEEHTSELQSRENLVCRLLLEKKKKVTIELYTSRA